MGKKNYEIDVIIPCYHSKGTIYETLDSLVSQTFKDFQVSLVADGDGEDYYPIVKAYKKRGLNIQAFSLEKNSGPGIARQYGIDHTNGKYLCFIDSDDMLIPQALYVLHHNIETGNFNIVSSSILREEGQTTHIIKSKDSVTWVLGKIYRRAYLEEISLRFRDDLRLSEDCYFNLVAFNSTDNKAGFDNWYLGIWKGNENSLTRRESPYLFDIHNVDSYIKSQVEALLQIVKNVGEISDELFIITLCLCYIQIQQAIAEQIEYTGIDDELKKLRGLPNITSWSNKIGCWDIVVKNAPIGKVYPERVVLFDETFTHWFSRLFG